MSVASDESSFSSIDDSHDSVTSAVSAKGVASAISAAGDNDAKEPVSLMRLIDFPTLITPCMLWLTSSCTTSSMGIGSQALLLDPVYKDALAPHVNTVSSIVLIGGIFGQLIGGALADWKGRKVGILVMLTLQLLGHSMYLFWTPSPNVLIGLMYVGRMVAGIGGSGCNPVTMSLAVEGAVNAEARTLRSAFTVMFMNVALTLVPLWTAILDSCGVPYTLLWRFTFGFSFIPAAFAYIGILRIEDSTEFRAARAAKLEAQKAVAAARVEQKSGTSSSVTSAEAPIQVRMCSSSNLFRLLYGVMIMTFINSVLYGFIMCSPLVSRDTLGLEGFQGTAWGSAIFGFAGVVSMGCSVPFLMRMGNLRIQKIGYAVQTPTILCTALVVFCAGHFDVAWLEFVGFIAAFMVSFSGAPIVSFSYVPTIFPVQIRGLFTAVCLCVSVVASFVVSVLAPKMYDSQGAWLVLVFAACLTSCLFCQIWFLYVTPAVVIRIRTSENESSKV
ncbi:MAG: hypothetical protein KVP17_000967 [Porospora cf. gigantea B]|uniref:uncharacterized protein n=1 Tax=Porospora cf. gigantea B TaxID=2853592 RepID=UPI003571A7D4|nr:MAG: hypothetical protein KVP17_000967 [Porospora cf. gigantea B]